MDRQTEEQTDRYQIDIQMDGQIEKANIRFTDYNCQFSMKFNRKISAVPKSLSNTSITMRIVVNTAVIILQLNCYFCVQYRVVVVVNCNY